MRTKPLPTITVLFLTFAASTAVADHRFGIGVFQWEVHDNFDVTTPRVTYEFGEIEKIWNVRLLLGGMYNFDNDGYYFSGGWLKEWTKGGKWSWGIGGEFGYYDGPKLGHEWEFYSRGVLNYHVSQSGFLRLEYGHISNASFGSTNPGSENIGLTYNWIIDK